MNAREAFGHSLRRLASLPHFLSAEKICHQSLTIWQKNPASTHRIEQFGIHISSQPAKRQTFVTTWHTRCTIIGCQHN